jgi:hypothetical protein
MNEVVDAVSGESDRFIDAASRQVLSRIEW